jgi:hypothetical protein
MIVQKHHNLFNFQILEEPKGIKTMKEAFLVFYECYVCW